ncbi:hypothetical protein CC99x_005765 [Candidatus Berkiella cookevillensis]|uniref:Uncharacterized protein n=1 Tax=Candidatus Berkiella cookevillensis TaxID=437022 RepID=A0A0Q9YHG6_9GAMM|nr:hypothetical protein [Candidatus Berkiella cookevillensis]MCS5708410.1 hypothetical protein [Candidatus Berkiella cookevillensis]
MKYYVVGSAISSVDGEQPTKDALLASLEALKKDETVFAFENRGLAQKYLEDKFEKTDKEIRPIIEIDAPAKQKIHKEKLEDGRLITGRDIAIEKVKVLNVLLNLSNKALNDVEINEALSDIKAPVAKVEEPAAKTEEPVAKAEEAAKTEEAKPSAIRSLFTKLKNAFFSMYVQIPLIGFGIAMQGGTALILEKLAQLGVTTAYPLILEAGLALALGAAFYGMGQAIVWGVSSAYNAITKKSEKASEETAAEKDASVDPDLTAKLAATLDTSKEAANEVAVEDNLVDNSPKVIRMSPKSSSVESSPKSSKDSSSSVKSSAYSSSEEASVSAEEEVSTKKASVRAKK